MKTDRSASLPYEHVSDLYERTGFATRVVIKLFGRRLNREIISPAVGRLFECGKIDSRSMHTVLAQFDPTQSGLVGRIIKGD